MDPSDCLNDEQLRLLLANAKPVEESATVELHLGECAHCQSRLAAFAGDLTIPSAVELRAPIAKIVEMFERDGVTLGASNTASGRDPRVSNDIAPLIGLLDAADHPQSLGRMGVYEISAVIGQGGMGVVLAGLDTKLKRRVAIKIPHQKQFVSTTEADRFLREAQAIAALRHQNIVLMYTVDEFKDLTFHVMELIDGDSVYELLQKGSRLEIPEVIRIGQGVAAALEAAHQEGIIHRDIKPANILIESGSGTVKVTDFGLAKSERETSLTDSSLIMGTPEYMSPEQVTGAPASTKSDLFSLGTVLYRLASNQSPFRRQTAIETMNAVCGAVPTPLHELNSDVPLWFSDLVHQLVAKSPDQRPESATAVLASLQSQVVPARPTSAPIDDGKASSNQSIRRRKIAVSGFLIAAALIAVVGSAIGLSNRDGESAQSSPGTSNEPTTENESYPFHDVASGETYSDLGKAITALPPEGVLEIRGHGPYVIAGIDLGRKPVTIRAANGFKPIIVNEALDRPGGASCLSTSANLTLEGLEIRWSMSARRFSRIDAAWEHAVIKVEDANLTLVHCRITSDRGTCAAVRNGSLVITDSHLLTDTAANMVWIPAGSQEIAATNCVFESAATNLMFNGIAEEANDPRSSIQLANNYLSSRQSITSVIEFPQRRFYLRLQNNLVDSDAVLCVAPGETQIRRVLSERQQRRMVAQLFDVEEDANFFRAGMKYVNRRRLGDEELEETLVATHSDWTRLWLVENSSSRELPPIDEANRPERQPTDSGQPWSHLLLLQSPGIGNAGPNLKQIGPQDKS